MTFALVQHPPAATGSSTAPAITFPSTPTNGNLLIFCVWAANNVTVTDSGSATEIGTIYGAFNRGYIFAKNAGGSESTTFTFTLSGSAAWWCFAKEVSTTDTWDAVSGSQFNAVTDTSGSNPSVTATIASSTSGAFLQTSGYMADSTTGNQEITTGFSNFQQPVATGTGRRAAQADKTSSGGSQTATYGTVDTSNDNRLAVMLGEFTVTSGASITPTDTTPNDGDVQTITASGMTGPVTAATISGKDILSDLSSTDPSSPITFTIDVSATEASEGVPRIGETSTISFTTATDGAVTTDVTIQPKTDWTRVVLAGTLDKTANGFLATVDADLGVTTAVDDIVYYSNARGEVITATGVYTGGTTVAYQSTEFVLQQGGSATTTATSEGGAFYPFGEAPSSGTITNNRISIGIGIGI